MHFILVILSCFYSACFAKIIKTNDIKVIETRLRSADKNTLVIFDVNNVLMNWNDQILKSKNAGAAKKLMKSLKARISNKKQRKEIISILFLESKTSPVDMRMISLVSDLQNSNIKVLMLTSWSTGSFGLIPKAEDLRLVQLAEHGYNFKKSWPHLQTKHLRALIEDPRTSDPIYKDGVVFIDQATKSESLEAFLKYANFKPKKITFVDDKVEHLGSVNQFAQNHNIEFMGIEYTKAYDEMQPLNLDIAKLQFEVLEKRKKWLSDDEASRLLSQ